MARPHKVAAAQSLAAGTRPGSVGTKPSRPSRMISHARGRRAQRRSKSPGVLAVRCPSRAPRVGDRNRPARPLGGDQRLPRGAPPGTRQPRGRASASSRSPAPAARSPSSWTTLRDGRPSATSCPEVLRRLHDQGIPNEDISISAGVGRHHAVDDAAMRARVGDEVASAYRCFSPPVDDLSQYVDLGTTPEGVPVRVFRPVAEADLRILIGSVLPHLQAGFGGGYKLIFPGCSHRSTLGALHRQGLGGDAGKLLGGDLESNPMRTAIRSAARLLRGPCFSISHLLGDAGQVFRVLGGDVDAVQSVLSREAAQPLPRAVGPAGRRRRRRQRPLAGRPDDELQGAHQPPSRRQARRPPDRRLLDRPRRHRRLVPDRCPAGDRGGRGGRRLGRDPRPEGRRSRDGPARVKRVSS